MPVLARNLDSHPYGGKSSASVGGYRRYKLHDAAAHRHDKGVHQYDPKTGDTPRKKLLTFFNGDVVRTGSPVPYMNGPTHEPWDGQQYPPDQEQQSAHVRLPYSRKRDCLPACHITPPATQSSILNLPAHYLIAKAVLFVADGPKPDTFIGNDRLRDLPVFFLQRYFAVIRFQP
ncbi:MAG: hypothetical protein U1D26_03270, partial [Patescibacteria group bacterium]|nr:hypothetical protein [Patescibacteria group bacterium]